jgi:hypothetical protein
MAGIKRRLNRLEGRAEKLPASAEAGESYWAAILIVVLLS